MHKLPAFVFKLLGISLVLMFLLDTTLVVVQTISVHSKVLNVAGIMQNEVARNNCMPTDLATMFESQLRDIVEDSTVAADTFRTNMRTDISLNGKTYKSLSEDNPAQYGEIVPLVIEITMQPSVVYMNVKGSDRAETAMLKKGRLDYTLKYSYSVPCLRYLK